ncbi:hypothetical protein LUZ60_018930 [Juncus effusus]|nr:hypothetical protein LUZ60_018930 [Juncus effusus]
MSSAPSPPPFFLRAASACASRAIGALLSSYFFIGRFGWTSPFFPNEKGKGCITSRCRFVSAPNEMGISYLCPFILMNGIKARPGSRRSNNRRGAPQYTIARSNWGSYYT